MKQLLHGATSYGDAAVHLDREVERAGEAGTLARSLRLRRDEEKKSFRLIYTPAPRARRQEGRQRKSGRRDVERRGKDIGS